MVVAFRTSNRRCWRSPWNLFKPRWWSEFSIHFDAGQALGENHGRRYRNAILRILLNYRRGLILRVTVRAVDPDPHLISFLNLGPRGKSWKKTGKINGTNSVLWIRNDLFRIQLRNFEVSYTDSQKITANPQPWKKKFVHAQWLTDCYLSRSVSPARLVFIWILLAQLELLHFSSTCPVKNININKVIYLHIMANKIPKNLLPSSCRKKNYY